MKQAEKVDSNSSLYSDTKQSQHFLNEKNVKVTKRAMLKVIQVLIYTLLTQN